MAKPRKAEEVIARATANGYERGAHEANDQKRGQGKHCSTTRKDHARTLNRYVIWYLAEMLEKHSDASLPCPTLDIARAECLKAGVEAPSLAKLKDFFRFYAATSSPQIVEIPTAESLVSVAEWFFPAFTKETGTETNEEDRSEIFSWIRTTLVEEEVVANVRRGKHNFTVVDLNRIMLTMWTEDDLSWIPERYRVQFTFIFHVFYWTGARLGAFFKGGLLYKDVEIALQRADGDKWSVIYKLDQRWVKGNRDPENIVFGAAAKEHNRLLYNETAFLVAMAIADGALYGINTLEDLYEQRLHPGEDYRPLRFHASALNRPILRKCTKNGGVSETEKMPQSAFLNIFKNAMLNAGYLCRSSVHAIRRGVGDKVSALYTPVQLAQHITHADTRIFGRSIQVIRGTEYPLAGDEVERMSHAVRNALTRASQVSRCIIYAH